MSIKALLLVLLLGLASFARADDLDDEVNVESEEQPVPPETAEDVEDATKLSKASPDADVASHVVQIDNGALPSNEFITVLVGFANTGEKELFVDGIEASFRYPQDFNYYIQNFTHFRYNRVVPSKTEASFMYRFFVHESYHSRSMGLSVNVYYHDLEGKVFESSAFNETIRIAEPVEGFDAEAFFLYVLLAAVVALLAFGGHQLFQTYGRRMVSSKSSAPAVETGTQKADVDTDWLPKELLQSLQKPATKSKSPKKETNGTKRSPGSDNESRQRRSQGTKLVE